jgi:hypothetical protein
VELTNQQAHKNLTPMDKLLDYLKFIPGYASDLVSLLTRPRSFLLERSNENTDNWTKALQFFGITAFLCFIMIFTFVKNIDFMTALSRGVVVWAAGVIFSSLAIRVGWKLVGGKATLSCIILTNIYAFSVAAIVSNVALMIFFGVLNIFLPTLFKEYMTILQMKDTTEILKAVAVLNSSRAFVVVSGIYYGVVAIFYSAWIIVVWVVYHRLNALSRIRSFAAFVISSFLGLIAWSAADLIGFAGLFPFFAGASK